MKVEMSYGYRVYGSLTQKSGLGQISLGTNQSVLPIYKSWLLEKRTLIEFNAMISFVVGIFYFLAWLTNRKERSFLSVCYNQFLLDFL